MHITDDVFGCFPKERGEGEVSGAERSLLNTGTMSSLGNDRSLV